MKAILNILFWLYYIWVMIADTALIASAMDGTMTIKFPFLEGTFGYCVYLFIVYWWTNEILHWVYDIILFLRELRSIRFNYIGVNYNMDTNVYAKLA